MEIGGLYQFVLIIILTGMLVGVGVLALDKFSATTGITTDAQVAINASRTAVGSVSNTWMGLIVTIGVLSIIIGLVIGGFYLAGRR
jgi:uncharacterized membrane-anchored protein